MTVCNNENGGMYFDTRSNPLLENSIVAFNDYYGIQVHGTSFGSTTLDVAYSDVYDNVIQSGVSHINYIEDNIDADPLFVDPAGGDYHLLADSPCIDAADPQYPLDPDGTRSDMGAFYFPQTTGVSAQRPVIATVQLGRGHPNPFRSMTRIRYRLPERRSVSVYIQDAAGRVVRTLVEDASQSGGAHTVVWDGRDAWGLPMPTGAYILRLTTGRVSASRGLLLIR